MTIHLPENLESPILAAVHSGRYASLDDAMAEAASLLVQRLKQEQAKQPATPGQAPPAHKPIWERFLERIAAIPDEEWDKLPVDGAEQHDHYIYGTPKRLKSQAHLRQRNTQGYGNDSRQNGPLSSRFLHSACPTGFAFYVETRTRRFK